MPKNLPLDYQQPTTPPNTTHNDTPRNITPNDTSSNFTLLQLRALLRVRRWQIRLVIA